jgi:hypothetical protein
MRRSLLAIPILSLWAICALAGPQPSTAPNLGGLKLGDSEDALKQVALPLKNKGDDAPGGPGTVAYKYLTANGNDLSVTFKDGKAVWIENDWNDSPDGDESLIKGLVFGKTNSMDIKALTGSNGYAHRGIAFHRIGDYLASFICYSLVDRPGTSLVVVSYQSIGTSPDDIRKYGNQVFHLRSIILANDAYLDLLWGKDTIEDPAYHPIAWSAVDRQPDGAAVDALRHSDDLLLSTVTTQEDRFSVDLPVGFHRKPSPGADANLYVFDDTAGGHRMISLDFDPIDARKRDAVAYLGSVMATFTMMHTQFQHTEPMKATVSGLDFVCSEWTGMTNEKLFGGRVCVAQRDDGHIMYSEMDFKHRYDDDATLYQQVFQSLKLQ